MSLEASLLARPSMSTEGLADEKDRLLTEQAKTIKELEAAVKSYEERGRSDSSARIDEERRAIRKEVEKEWAEKVEEEKRVREEKERWAGELTKALDKEKRVGDIYQYSTAANVTNAGFLFYLRRDRSWKKNDGHSLHSSANSTLWA